MEQINLQLFHWHFNPALGIGLYGEMIDLKAGSRTSNQRIG